MLAKQTEQRNFVLLCRSLFRDNTQASLLATKDWKDGNDAVFFGDTAIILLNYDAGQTVHSEAFATDLGALPANRTAKRMEEDEGFVALQEVCVIHLKTSLV